VPEHFLGQLRLSERVVIHIRLPFVKHNRYRLLSARYLVSVFVMLMTDTIPVLSRQFDLNLHFRSSMLHKLKWFEELMKPVPGLHLPIRLFFLTHNFLIFVTHNKWYCLPMGLLTSTGLLRLLSHTTCFVLHLLRLQLNRPHYRYHMNIGLAAHLALLML